MCVMYMYCVCMCVCVCLWYICVHTYFYICHNEYSFIRANALILKLIICMIK